VLELADGTHFLGSDDLGGRLYVRNHYEKLFETVQGLVNSGKRRVLVTGNPGIGKSCFGLYVLSMLAKERTVTVIWQSARSGHRYLFKGDTVVMGGMESFVPELGNQHSWCGLYLAICYAPFVCTYHQLTASEILAKVYD